MTALRARALLWLVMALGVAALCVAQLMGPAALQTNLLALLPATERNPVAEQAVGKLADATGNRAVFLVAGPSPTQAAQAARAFAASLRKSGAFRNVVADIGAIDPTQLTALYVQHRHHLLTQADRTALLHGEAALESRLQQKLNAPMRFGLSVPVTEDPFGFADDWLAALPLNTMKLEPVEGVLMARGTGGKAWAFIAAELSGSAYGNEAQRAAVGAVDHAEAAARQAGAEAEVLRLGTVFYAQSARSDAESEFHFIGAGSLAGMLALLYLVFRSPRPLVLGLLSVGFGIAAASVATIWRYGEIHLITLVFGASLIGEAIDYAVQYFAAHLGAGARWDPMAALARIGPGLTMALATSLLGYGALMFAPFPALSQIALFALVGLSAAWLSVFLLLPALLPHATTRDPAAALAAPQRLLAWWSRHMDTRRSLLLAAALLLLAAPGWFQLRADDDIHLLITRPAALVQQEERIRELTGFANSSQFFLVEGATPDEVLAREERLAARLVPLVAGGALASWQGLASFVPSHERQALNYTVLREQVFPGAAPLAAMFDRAGLRDGVAARELAAFQAAAQHPLTLREWLDSPLSAPLRHLWLGATAHGYAAVVLPQGIRSAADVEPAAAGLDGVTFVDKAGSISRLFTRYRHGSAFWLLGAFVLVYAVLALRYGWSRAALVLAPAILAAVVALGISGYIGKPLTLFNLMALMLVLGVGVNYPIFLLEGGGNEAATLAGVLLSAGTTLLSFGLLSFSSMPALSGFGLTLLLGIGLAVLLSPMALSMGHEASA